MSMKWHVVALLLVAGAMVYVAVSLAVDYGSSFSILVIGAAAALVMIRLGRPADDAADPPV
jgi:hypothetical protein